MTTNASAPTPKDPTPKDPTPKDPKPKDVVITGLGPVTNVGVGCEALFDALGEGRTDIQTRTLATDIGAAVDLPMASMPPAERMPALQPHIDHLAEQGLVGYRDLTYALLAIELACADAQLSIDQRGDRCGMVQAFEAPGVEATVTDLFQLFSGPPPTDGPPQVYDLLAPRFYNMQPFLYVHTVAKAMGLHGFCTNVHNACSTGAFAIETAAQCIRSGQADVMVVVGGEAYETAVRLEWFRRLELYAKDAEMRPFDKQPSGFYVGEGAAALVLESFEHAQRRGARSYVTYRGGAFAHQGWKQTIPDVRRARLADVIQEALVHTGVDSSEIDLIVPHGASTNLSDGYEAFCLGKALGKSDCRAVMAAFKPYFGHMLATSGIIEMICAILAVTHGTIPATPNTPPDRTNLPFPLITEQTQRPVSTILKLSTGFTGHDAASVFTKT